MNDSVIQRLSSAHLEDLAYVVLSARAGDERFDLYPDLSADVRTRLRSRIKQFSRYDWPSSMSEDPALRRGYTLRQCFRLTVALMLVDAHLPAGLAAELARTYELGFLFAIADRLTDPFGKAASPDNSLAVIAIGEIQEGLGFTGWADLQVKRLQFVKRSDLASLGSGAFSGPSAWLIVDVAPACSALWQWISGRRLMDDAARLALLAEIEKLRPEAQIIPVPD